MNSRTHCARGVALVLVLCALALVAVLGFAMLSSASLQTQASNNSLDALNAETLAESGIELAALYLQYPERAPVMIPDGGYWTGANGIQFGASVTGTIDVVVSNPEPKVYHVVSTGHVGAGSPIQRTVTAELRVEPGFKVRNAMGYAGSGFVPTTATINNDLQAAGLVTNRGTINGRLIAPVAPVNLGTIRGGWKLPTADNSNSIPSWSKLRDFRTYDWHGTTYSAVEIAALPNGTVLGPTANNPAGVYLCKSDLAIYYDVKINGTLIVDGAQFNVYGGRNQITPQPGFPAAIFKGDCYLRGPGVVRDVTFNGLTWVGGAIKSSGSVSTGFFNFSGAVLFGGSGSVDTTYGGRLTVTYDSSKITGVELSTDVVPAGVEVLSYK